MVRHVFVWLSIAWAGCAGADDPPPAEVVVTAPATSESAPRGDQPPSAAPSAEQPAPGPLTRARIESTRALVEARRAAVELWQATHSDLCPTHDDLVRDRVIDPQSAPDDPWGTRLQIVCTEEGIEVRSAGPDKELGTGDDIPSVGG